jgi:heme A synthase
MNIHKFINIYLIYTLILHAIIIQINIYLYLLIQFDHNYFKFNLYLKYDENVYNMHIHIAYIFSLIILFFF